MSKKVQFDYFKVYRCFVRNGQLIEELCNLNEVLEALDELTVADTTRACMSEQARVQFLNFDRNTNLWEIQLLRLREHNVPGIADEDGAYDIIILEDNRYVGEFASALYDVEEEILVLHRNRNSITPSGLEEYLSNIANGYTFRLKPIVSNRDVRDYIDGKLYRKISMRVHTENLNELDGDRNARGIVAALRNLANLNGATIKIDVSLGHGRRDHTLCDDLINTALNDLEEFDGVNYIKLDIKDAPDTKVETVDLLSNRIKDVVEFNNIDRHNPLQHRNVYDRLLNCYEDRKANGELYI